MILNLSCIRFRSNLKSIGWKWGCRAWISDFAWSYFYGMSCKFFQSPRSIWNGFVLLHVLACNYELSVCWLHASSISVALALLLLPAGILWVQQVIVVNFVKWLTRILQNSVLFCSFCQNPDSVWEILTEPIPIWQDREWCDWCGTWWWWLGDSRSFATGRW